MSDDLAKKIAEAKAKMFGSQTGGKVVILVKGDIDIKPSNPKVEVRRT